LISYHGGQLLRFLHRRAKRETFLRLRKFLAGLPLLLCYVFRIRQNVAVTAVAGGFVNPVF